MKNIMKNIRNDSLNHKRFCFPPFQSNQFFNSINVGGNNPVKKGSKLNVQTTFRKCPGLLLNVLYTFNLRPVSTGKVTWRLFHDLFERVFSLDANLHIMGGG